MAYPLLTPATRARPVLGQPNWGQGAPAMPSAAGQGRSNWGAGSQPVATTPAYTPRNIGSFTSADLNRRPNGSRIDGREVMTPTGAPIQGGTMNVMRAPPLPATGAIAAPARVPYNPPPQTERKNPLSGDNNYPLEGQTTAVARAPFIQRGVSLPAGRDALPAPARETLDEDTDIGASMQGTQARLRGTPSPFARRFGDASKSNAYQSLLNRVMATS